MKTLIAFTALSSIDDAQLSAMTDVFTGSDYKDTALQFWNVFVPMKIAKYMETGACQQLNHVLMTAEFMHKKSSVLPMLKKVSAHGYSRQKKGFAGKQDATAKKLLISLINHGTAKGKVARWYAAYSAFLERDLKAEVDAGKVSKASPVELCKAAAKLVKKYDGESLVEIVKQVTIAYNAQHTTPVTAVAPIAKAAAKAPKRATSARSQVSKAKAKGRAKKAA